MIKNCPCWYEYFMESSKRSAKYHARKPYKILQECRRRLLTYCMGSIVFCACKSSPLLSKLSQFSLWPSLKMLIFKSSTKLQNKSSKSYSSMPRSEIYSLRSPRSEIYSLPFSVSLTLLKRKFSHLVYCSNCVFISSCLQFELFFQVQNSLV